ncbi:hypothetical protein DF186_22390, partial [Enterococcus hirae]
FDVVGRIGHRVAQIVLDLDGDGRNGAAGVDGARQGARRDQHQLRGNALNRHVARDRSQAEARC